MADRLTTDPVEIETLREVMPQAHQTAFDVLARLYGGDSETLINGLMDMTVRAAILTGVSGENFAAGMKHHWDYYAEEINRREV